MQNIHKKRESPHIMTFRTAVSNILKEKSKHWICIYSNYNIAILGIWAECSCGWRVLR